ncbi:MAG: hypothetical protein ACMXYD_01570 [Candidatus Woesearchaeota archaeon]
MKLLTRPDAKQTVLTHGDADGVLAGVIQLKENPQTNTGIGWKAEMNLAERLQDTNTPTIIIQDLSFRYNQQAVEKFLEEGKNVIYIDHRGKPSEFATNHPNFTNHINASPLESTTNILYNLHNKRYPKENIIGLTGDRTMQTARNVAKKHHVTDEAFTWYAEVGYALNINSIIAKNDTYWSIHPSELLECLAEEDVEIAITSPLITRLVEQRKDLMSDAIKNTQIEEDNDIVVIHSPEGNLGRVSYSDLAWQRWLDESEKKNQYVFSIANIGKDAHISIRGPKNIHEIASKLGRGGGRYNAGHATVANRVGQINLEYIQEVIYDN